MRPPVLPGLFLALLLAFPAGAAPPPLTPAGLGPVKVGMREREAVRLGLSIPHDDEVSTFECRELTWPAYPSVRVMAQKGRITRISLYEAGPVRTDKGFGVGSSEADIVRAYGATLKVEPHHYEGKPAHYLTAWSANGARGVRYETNTRRKVTAVHAGDRSIELVESCL